MAMKIGYAVAAVCAGTALAGAMFAQGLDSEEAARLALEPHTHVSHAAEPPAAPAAFVETALQIALAPLSEEENSLIYARSEAYADIPLQQYDFDTSHIEQLLANGSIKLPHPQGGLFELTLERVENAGELRTVTVRCDGLSGVITQLITEEGQSFFATLATASGVYSIEHRSRHTRIINQRQLDLRINPAHPDYRVVPLS